MKKYLTTILFTILATVACQAQQYFVKLNGDTVYGKANLNPILDNSRMIRFVTKDGEKMNLKPHLTKAVFYSDDYIYVPVIYQQQRLFMILMEGGSLSAYRYITKDGSSTQVSRVLSKNGDAIEVNKFNFKNQMTDFLGDCPEVVEGIEEKKYRLRALTELVKAYNNCTSTENNLANNQHQAPPQAPKTPEPSSDASKVVLQVPAEVVSTSDMASPSVSNGEVKNEPDLEAAANHIESFREHVASIEDLNSKTDILELIKDLENRWQQEGEIPDYLWGALESMTKSDASLTEKVAELKSSLTKK